MPILTGTVIDSPGDDEALTRLLSKKTFYLELFSALQKPSFDAQHIQAGECVYTYLPPGLRSNDEA